MKIVVNKVMNERCGFHGFRVKMEAA